MYHISFSVKGTAVALYLWHVYPTLKTIRATPAFLAKKKASCEIRYHVEGTITDNELSLVASDALMMGTSCEMVSFCRVVE